MRLSSTGRNDTDDFFALFLIESMDDQQNRTGAYGSNGYPPLRFLTRVNTFVRTSPQTAIDLEPVGRFRFVAVSRHNVVRREYL